jgi:hypothetical protein
MTEFATPGEVVAGAAQRRADSKSKASPGAAKPGPGGQASGTATGNSTESKGSGSRFTVNSTGVVEDAQTRDDEGRPNDTQPTTDRIDTAAAQATPETEQNENLNNKRGVTLARSLLDGRAAEVASTLSENPSKADMALIYEGLYVDGFDPLEEGKKVGIMGEIKIAADDGTTFSVYTLTKQSGEPGNRTYTCDVDVTRDGQTTVTQEEIPGYLLAEAHRANYADEIAGKFTSQTQRELISQYAADPEFTPSDELLTQVEESQIRFRELDGRIKDTYLPFLQSKLKEFRDVNAGDVGYDQKVYLQELMGQLNAAQVMDSNMLGAKARNAALSGIQDAAAGPGGEWVRDGLADDLTNLKPEIDAEQQRLEAFVNQSNLSEDKRQQIIEQAKDPEQLGALLRNPDFIQIPGILEEAFGKNVTLAEAQAITNSFIDTSNLTEEQKRSLKDTAKTVGKAGLITLLIALAAGVGAAVLTSELVGTVAKTSGQ